MAGTPGLKTSSLGGLAALVAFFTVAVLAGTPARAATNEELSSCSEIKQTIEQPDGSIVGMGDCRYGVSPAPRIVLVGLNPDPSFDLFAVIVPLGFCYGLKHPLFN